MESENPLKGEKQLVRSEDLQWRFSQGSQDKSQPMEKAESGTHVEKLMKDVDLDEPTSFFDHVYLGCTQRECKPNDTIIEEYTNMFE